MITKEEFLAEAEAKYYWLQQADKLARELEKHIKHIRGMGYKVIVLGNTVRIT